MDNIFDPLLEVATNKTLELVRNNEKGDYVRLEEIIYDLTKNPQYAQHAYELEDILNNLVGCTAKSGVVLGFELCVEVKNKLA